MAEHMLQFGVWIDDDAIQKRIEESIANKAVEEAEAVSKAAEEYFHGRGSRWSKTTRIEDLANEAIEKEAKAFIDSHAQEIIDLVVSKMSASVVSTKAFKEAVQMKIMTIPAEEFTKAEVK